MKRVLLSVMFGLSLGSCATPGTPTGPPATLQQCAAIRAVVDGARMTTVGEPRRTLDAAALDTFARGMRELEPAFTDTEIAQMAATRGAGFDLRPCGFPTRRRGLSTMYVSALYIASNGRAAVVQYGIDMASEGGSGSTFDCLLEPQGEMWRIVRCVETGHWER